MRASDSPFVADWFAISLRWLALVGVVIGLAIDGNLLSTANLLMALLALWNVIQTLMAGLSIRMNWHRQINLGVDAAMTLAFFTLQDGYNHSVWWVGVVPLMTAAIYFNVRGAVLTALALGLAQVAVIWFRMQNLPALLFSVAMALIYIGAGWTFGYLARRVYNGLRTRRVARLEEEEKARQIETERLRAIYTFTAELMSTLDYRRVLDNVLDLSAAVLNPYLDEDEEDPLVSAVMLFEGPELAIGSARRFTSADMRVTLPAAKGALAEAINGGDPVRLLDMTADPELSHIVSLRVCKSLYIFPLRSGFNIYGVLLFAHPDPAYFADDRCELIDILGRQAVVAIQNARLYQDLVEEKERMIEVQEEARKKLARDLHDGPTQSVAAIAMRLNLARRMLERSPETVEDELAKVEELARRTTKEIRHMLFTLRPLVLESQGLTAALAAMAEKMKETFNQEVIIKVDDKLLEQIEMGKQGVIFYIVEEAVNNARKHARASQIWVNLRALKDEIVLLEIKDNGVGFDLDSVMSAYDRRGSLGMINLRERTELVNGLLHIETAPGRGSTIQVFIPLSEKAADRLRHAKQ